MKREYIALALIAIIFVASIFNMHYVEAKTMTLTHDIEAAENLYNSGDNDDAVLRIQDSMDNWFHWDSYAHIMLRHSELDIVTDAYFDLLSELESENSVPEASFKQLKDQLHSLSIMEQMTLGSIF